MSQRYYVYRLIDDSNSDRLFQGVVAIPEQTNLITMNDHDAHTLVADAVIKQLIRSNHRPRHSHMEFCELNGPDDPRLVQDGETICFEWDSCKPDELELTLRDED